MPKTRQLLAVSTSLATLMCGVTLAAQPAAAAPAEQKCGNTAYLQKFSPRQKLAQLLTVGVSGTADALSVVRDEQVGGIFIGSGTNQDILTEAKTRQLKSAAKVPLMVTIDEEGGRVSRVRNLIGPAPSAREVARTKSPEQAYDLAKTRAAKLKNLGITVNFAPDVDVSSQPDNTVIGDRSFSGKPDAVTKYGRALIRAHQDAGVGAVIKHFPGHGAASGDSHTGAVKTPPLEQLKTRDLVPFRDLVTAGAAVMVGHLDVPGLTKPNQPASISPQVMSLLRKGTGYGAKPFDGPIFTDDLGGMAAITNRMGIAAAVEAALVAGADSALWISNKEVPQVLNRLEQAVKAGRLKADQVDQSVLRLARFKGALTC